LRDSLSQLPVVIVFLAFQPSVRFSQELIMFFRDRITEPHIIDIIIDDALVAGAIVEYKGRRHDLSWITFMRQGHFT
jgi:F0F1-type ATP synthase delta subunit